MICGETVAVVSEYTANNTENKASCLPCTWSIPDTVTYTRFLLNEYLCFVTLFYLVIPLLVSPLTENTRKTTNAYFSINPSLVK